MTERLTCPICGKDNLKGRHGLDVHRGIKHPEVDWEDILHYLENGIPENNTNSAAQKERERGYFLDTHQVKHYFQRLGLQTKKVALRIDVLPHVLSAKINGHQKWDLREVFDLCCYLKVLPQILWNTDAPPPPEKLIKAVAEQIDAGGTLEGYKRRVLQLKQEKLQQMGRDGEEIAKLRQSVHELTLYQQEMYKSALEYKKWWESSGQKWAAEKRDLENQINALKRQKDIAYGKLTSAKKDSKRAQEEWIADCEALERQIQEWNAVAQFIASVLEVVLADSLPDFSRVRLLMLRQYILNSSLGETLWMVVNEDRQRIEESQEQR